MMENTPSQCFHQGNQKKKTLKHANEKFKNYNHIRQWYNQHAFQNEQVARKQNFCKKVNVIEDYSINV